MRATRWIASVWLAVVLAAAVAAGPATAQLRDFKAEGSDAILGVGARHIAMGGTGASTADDPHAVFYNAALLAWMDRVTVSATRQLDGALRPYSFIGATVPLPFADQLGFDVTFGVARYNRIHARSRGLLRANAPEGIYLRYLLPGITGAFRGRIDSKTLVNRFAVGVSPHALPGLSLGANVDWIDCKTDSCGVHGGSAGYETRTIRATALSFGVSAAYRLGDWGTLAASYTDIDTTLDVRTRLTDATGTEIFTFQAKLPRKLHVEAAVQATDKILVAAGYQRLWGKYGNYELDFQTLHLGGEYAQSEALKWRLGGWVPLELTASNGLNTDIPFFVAPTAGMGWSWNGLTTDVALYAHPVMTMHRRFPELSADLTLTYRF